MQRSKAGFSLIEALVVIAFIMVGASVAVIQMRQSMAVIDADKAANLVVSQCRYARQVAVDQRRNVVIEFQEPNRIKITREDEDEDVVVSEVTLPAGFRFDLPGGAGDTPENYGNEEAIWFNGGASGRFLGDGTFVDADGVILNGTVFTMGGNNGTARAVTLTGASGRTKQYQRVDNDWVQR